MLVIPWLATLRGESRLWRDQGIQNQELDPRAFIGMKPEDDRRNRLTLS